jgi:type VI secretion system protein ImpL
LSKFPFNSNATTEATLAEMNAVFHPQQGSLWQFYNANLSKYLMLQGTQYVENPAGGVRLTPQFLMFWNRVAGFSATAYPNNSPQPRIPLTLRLAQSRSVESATLSIEGQSKQSKGASPEPMEFVWSGSGQPVTLNARLSGTDYNFGRYDGPWALFRFLADSENWTTSGGTSTFERIARQGLRGTPITTQDGTPVSVKFELETGRAPIFQRDYFGTLRCVSDIARP